jgi:GMP synthase-like glutamine amidotransferase
MNIFEVNEEVKNLIVNAFHGEVFRSKKKENGNFFVKLDKRQERICRENSLVSDEQKIKENL